MNEKSNNYENKTKWVVIITTLTMFLEISFGLSTKSMSLLADGIHMGSHVLAIGFSWIAYVFIRKSAIKNNAINSNNVLNLSGYTSGLILLIFAFVILIEAIKRFYFPENINFRDAIIVAIIGLVVNIVSAIILHHKEEHSDINIKAAYLHVLADALTSVSAIIGLYFAYIFNLLLIDTIVAIVSSFIIINWAVRLIKNSVQTLIKT